MSNPGHRGRWMLWLGGSVLAVLVLGALGSAPARRPPVYIALTANVKALLTTCKSCTYVTVGGMPQKATMMKRWRRDTAGAFTALDAGDWSGYGARFSDSLTMIKAMKMLGYAAANLADSEAAFGDPLFDACKQSGLPLISANLLDAQSGQPVLPPYVVFAMKGVRIGAIGVIGPEAAETGFALPARYRLADVRETLAAQVPRLRSQCDVLVVLAHVPLPEIKQLAAEVPGVDLFVGGSVHGKVPEGEMVGKTLVVQPHRYAVVVVKMAPGASGRYEAVKWPSYVVPRKGAEDPEVAALVERGVQAPGLPTAARPIGPRQRGYAGAERCAQCHADIHVAWKPTPHAKAWDSLAKGSPEMPSGHATDPKCLWCHTTSVPGAAASTELKAVQCEACHGPFSLHEERYVKGDFTLSDDQWRHLCMTCHDPKNSPEFDLETYRAKVVGPGHGKK